MSQKNKKNKICYDCGIPASHHLQTWLEELTDRLFLFRFSGNLSRKIKSWLDILLERLFIFFRLASLENNFSSTDINIRSACFIEEARKEGLKFKVLRAFSTCTNHFQMQIGQKIFRFESLPVGEFLSKYDPEAVDDKELVRKWLKKGGFPFVEGRAFWFYQKKKAINWAIKHLSFPLVVKPRSGSFSRHVSIDIKDIHQLEQAVNKAIKYSPNFVVEKFVPYPYVYRGTVIDFELIACAKRLAANVIGDGKHTISELIDIKNKHPYRGSALGDKSPLCQIVIDETTKKLLAETKYEPSTIPAEGEIVYLQKNPFIRLGADVIDVTDEVHPANVELFQNVAKFFDIRVVGIDLMNEDISRPWGNQLSAILELNSLPCIEIHHFPSSGKPRNVAGALVKMVSKYYKS